MGFFPSSTWNILYFKLCPLPLVLPHRRFWLSLIIIVCLKGKLNLWVIQVVVPKYSMDLYGSNYCGSAEVRVHWDEFIDKSVIRSIMFPFGLRKNPIRLLRRKCATADLNFLQKWDGITQFWNQGLHNSIYTLGGFVSGTLSCDVNVHPPALVRYSPCRVFILLPSSQWLHAIQNTGLWGQVGVPVLLQKV